MFWQIWQDVPNLNAESVYHCFFSTNSNIKTEISHWSEIQTKCVSMFNSSYRRSQYYKSTLVHNYVVKLFLSPFLW